MSLSNSTQPLNLPDTTPNPPVKTESTSPLESESNGAEGNTAYQAVFDNWNISDREVSLHERVLISIVSISYAQSADKKDLQNYLLSLKPEVKQAFSDRAAKILLDYDKEVAAAAKDTDVKSTWIDATKYGIRTHLDDFAIGQIQSFRELDEFIRERTSLKSQLLLTFLVALALSIFVGAVRPAVTIFDDLRGLLSPPPSQQTTPPTGKG